MLENWEVIMGCAFVILRSVVALILGVVVFLGFLFLLLLYNVSDKLLSADFYTDTINGEDTYNRIYNEVLLDQNLERTTQDLLGNVQVLSQAEVVGLVKQILPPQYLQSQVEGSIQRTVDYLNEDRDNLDVYIELGAPLDKVKPVLLAYINKRIEQLPVIEPVVSRCDAQVLQDVAGQYEGIYRGLIDGKMPDSIPSFKAIAQPCRIAIFDILFQQLTNDPSLEPRVKAGLRERRSEIRQEFFEGDTTGVWQAAAPAVATPLMDDAIAQIKAKLDDGNRLDLIHRFAVWSDGVTEPELRSNIATARDRLNTGRKFGKPAALAMLIAGSILLGLIHFPSLKNGLRWPGLTLFLTGLVIFIGGKVMESQLPGRLRELVAHRAGQVSDIPPSVTDLVGDLLVSFGNQLAEGIAAPALILLIVGALLFGASFFVFRLSRFIPGVR